MTALPPVDTGAEFDRQLAILLDKGYPAVAGLGPEEFAALLAPLRDAAVEAIADSLDRPPAEGRVPFLLVLGRALVPVEAAMPLTSLAGGSKPGFVDRSFEPGALARFVATPAAAPPDPRAYLLLDVDRGEEFCGVVPEQAMATVERRRRTPLTIEEGIALVTQYPAVLARNKCFSLGGSRCGDRRVPAIWISGNAPKLGWCWAGNPHSWLGMASAADRTGTGTDLDRAPGG